MDYRSTLSSAQDFSMNGKLEDWVHAYLLSDGNNETFSRGLKMVNRFYIGPLKMPLSLFSRCCGPEENMKWRVNAAGFEQKVNKLEEVMKNEDDLPPLIVNYVDGRFDLSDGNHRYEAATRLGIKEKFVIIWITDKHDYDLFQTKYAEYL